MILTPYRKYQYEEIKTNPQTKTPTTPRWEKPLTRASICQYGSSCSFISNRAVDTNNLLNRTAPPPRTWTLEVGFLGENLHTTLVFSAPVASDAVRI